MPSGIPEKSNQPTPSGASSVARIKRIPEINRWNNRGRAALQRRVSAGSLSGFSPSGRRSHHENDFLSNRLDPILPPN
jgi:hypothetical protein